ncbi:MAG: glycoside hydrolase family 20 zincin-like fold domain-containing protein [Niameybacter sp.]|uniref:glycoside hydrolase family 20 zincin-like fold domain-containing protein n=1 Tax=Niameybacter sp. TaxID=2033640 RepID=UPI002FC94520
MYLLPQPKHLNLAEGQFILKPSTCLLLDATCDFDDLNAIVTLQEEIQKSTSFMLPISKSFHAQNVQGTIQFVKKAGFSKEAYALSITADAVTITASTGAGIFYGVQTLRQIIRQSGAVVPALEIADEPHFANRGFYHDLTRGKVATLETLKELVDRAAFYKLNQIQLYVEHSFAFAGLSEVWMDKDPITAEEILLLDQYCQKRHVELVPSLSTFGHFYEILKSKSFNHLCEIDTANLPDYSFVDRMAHHTLNTLEEGSFELVEKMLNEFIPLFSSSQFNICCDETFDLGRGRSKEKADEVGSGRLYVDFLNKIITCVKQHDKKVMFWGDVILHHPELLSEIPEDVVCLTWDYSSTCGDHSVKTIAETGREQYVCPGVGGWSMLMNLMWNAFENIRRMAEHGREHGATGLLNTDWGDYGHVNLFANSMPGMIHGANLSWNPQTEETDFTQTYQAISRLEYGDTSETLVSLLHQLSGRQGACWSEVVRWKELQHNKHDEVEVLSSFNVERILNGYQTALTVEQSLLALSGSIRHNTFDMQEFLIAAKGIQVVDDFVLTLIQDKVGTPEAVPTMNKVELAAALETWFTQYASIWRARNKESELYRIREVVAYMSGYLRDNIA